MNQPGKADLGVPGLMVQAGRRCVPAPAPVALGAVLAPLGSFPNEAPLAVILASGVFRDRAEAMTRGPDRFAVDLPGLGAMDHPVVEVMARPDSVGTAHPVVVEMDHPDRAAMDLPVVVETDRLGLAAMDLHGPEGKDPRVERLLGIALVDGPGVKAEVSAAMTRGDHPEAGELRASALKSVDFAGVGVPGVPMTEVDIRGVRRWIVVGRPKAIPWPGK